MNPRLAFLVVLALVVPGLLSGCFAGKETRAGADKLVLAYDEDLSGVAGVQVESGVEGLSDDYVETAITLELEATVDDVTALIVDHLAKVEKSGLGGDFNLARLRFQYGVDHASLSMKWVGDPDEVEIRTGVEHWFIVNSLVGPHVQLVLGSDGSELYGVQGDVSEIYRTLASNSVMAADDAVWDVTGSLDQTEVRFATEGVPDEERLAAWDQLVAALGTLPAGAAATRLDVSVAGRAVVDLYLVGPVTFADDKDALWPAFAAQLDAVPLLDDEWGYFVSAAPAETPTSTEFVISLLSDAKPTNNHDDAYRFSKAAYDYVHGR